MNTNPDMMIAQRYFLFHSGLTTNSTSKGHSIFQLPHTQSYMSVLLKDNNSDNAVVRVKVKVQNRLQGVPLKVTHCKLTTHGYVERLS